jgi:hypothetical protein
MKYRAIPNVSFTMLNEEEAVLLDLKTRRYYSLNETGATIWQGIQAGHDESRIVQALVDAFDVDRGAALQHVRSFLERLAEDGLVQKD